MNETVYDFTIEDDNSLVVIFDTFGLDDLDVIERQDFLQA